MNLLQEAAITMYHWSAAPARWLRAQRWKQAGQMPVAILFYHRVADTHPNPWTISRRGFVKHLDWLQTHFDLLSLEQCQHRLRPGGNSRPSVAITFDDGYAENSQFALPLLLERGIPFTYFVTLGNVVSQQPFAHDAQRGAPLPVDTVEMLQGLAAVGVEIGGHTRTHADLGGVSDEARLYDEIIQSSIELGQIVGTPIRYFAFPFGQPRNLNHLGAGLAKQHGMLGVCSAYGGFNFPGDDVFHLQRIHGDPSLVRLQNWLSFDSRVTRIPKLRFECDAPPRFATSG